MIEKRPIEVAMKPQPTFPPPSDIQFLLSLIRISFPGEPATRELNELQELAAKAAN